ncbi:MAG: amidohydrolase [Rhodobacteraceae bacterium]|nr:amidohydrolase [Paracoccaceae bacterium]
MPIPNSLMAKAELHAEWRRDFHRHPEVAFEEKRTAGLVAERLRGFGCDQVVEGLGGTGVVGVIHGRGGSAGWDAAKAVLFRADMDALPMTEANGFEHVSQNPGAMHGCGHDGHTTMLLAAAQYLAETRAFDGSLVLCFQPAEEKGGGAGVMIRDGLLERFPCREAYALHNLPGLPVGAFKAVAGPITAAAWDFQVSVKGVGGHAAHPESASDTIVAAAQFVTAAQAIPARGVNPTTAVVLSFTTINGGDAFNVLPDEVRLKGTVRCFNTETGRAVVDRLHVLAAGLSLANGAKNPVTITIDVDPDAYPATINSVAETDFARSVAAEVSGAENVFDARPEMGAEDFSYFLEQMPGSFLYIGNGDSAPLHNSSYDFNDSTTAYGAAYFVRLAERALPLS